MTLTQVNDVLPPMQVRVDFGAGIPNSVQGPALFALERMLREQMGVPAEVYKTTAPDDLKRRREMTDTDRKRL